MNTNLSGGWGSFASLDPAPLPSDSVATQTGVPGNCVRNNS